MTRISKAGLHRCVKLKRAIKEGAVVVNILKQEQVFTSGKPHVLLEFCPWCGASLSAAGD